MSMELPSRADRVSVFCHRWGVHFARTLLKIYKTGMTGCLGVGSSAAKTLAAALNKPLVGVHHMVYLLSLAFDP